MNYTTLKDISDLLTNTQIIGNQIYTQQMQKITPEKIVFISAEKNISINTANARVIIEAILSRDLLPNIKKYESNLNHPVFGSPKTIKDITTWKTKKTKNIEELLINFPFADKISRSRAIALLITPFIYINGIKPIGVYLGNRERIGKDYLASITRILANDTAGELPPLQNDEETRKTLLALSMANEEFAHFSNNIGHMNSPSLEQAVTSKVLKGRILGKSEVINVPFNLITTLSGNAGWSLTPDLTYRSIIVALHSDDDNILSRNFKNCPALMAGQHREEYWNFIKKMYQKWVKKGKPNGKLNNATFPEWAKIIGGIMEVNGYINPLTPTNAGVISSLVDRDGEAWKELLPALYASNGIYSIKEMMQIAINNEMFDFLDFGKHGSRVFFGKLCKKYCGRWFGKYRLNKMGAILIGTNTGKQQYEVEFNEVKP